jgi:proteasome lid subunit RPN8/RPN11
MYYYCRCVAVHVRTAIPCRSLDVDDASVNVEMDPASQLEAAEKISGMGMSVIGWYHSHPTFVNQPSVRDGMLAAAFVCACVYIACMARCDHDCEIASDLLVFFCILFLCVYGGGGNS